MINAYLWNFAWKVYALLIDINAQIIGILPTQLSFVKHHNASDFYYVPLIQFRNDLSGCQPMKILTFERKLMISHMICFL